MRLNPYHPERFWSHLARACFAARRYAEAVDALRCISSPDALVRAGYWYDAVALAVRSQDGDGGAALAWLFRQAELRTMAGTGAAR